MSDDTGTGAGEQTDANVGSPGNRRTPLAVGLSIVAILFALAWMFLPTMDFFVEPVAPEVRNDISEAIEAATDPADRARLRLDLGALEQQDAARRNALRGTIAQVGTALLAGAAAAWGAVSAWRQLQDNRREAEAAQQRTDRQLQLAREELEDNRRQAEAAQADTNEQLRLARDGQLTERFTRAVDQLGNESLDVRLGGIYALERIARDSESDMPIIVEVLAAFVRGHSPLPGSPASDESTTDPTTDDEGAAEPLSSRAAAVQAALAVLGRMRRQADSVRMDLSTSDLRGADLVRANLQRANLARANLQNADLDDANFDGAWLADANLQDARLSGANLQRAQLADANLDGARLGGANLQGARLGRANLRRVRLGGADLEGAWLGGADLEGAWLGGANLRDAHLDGANVQRADFEYADLSRAGLAYANLRHTRLRGANLEGAWLGGANLEGAWLGGANLHGATVDSATTWPSGFDPEAAGVIFVVPEDDRCESDEPHGEPGLHGRE